MAFVRKNGAHRPRNTAARNWNAELLQPVSQCISDPWIQFEKKIGDCKDQYFAQLAKLLDNIRDDLSGEEKQLFEFSLALNAEILV